MNKKTYAHTQSAAASLVIYFERKANRTENYGYSTKYIIGSPSNNYALEIMRGGRQIFSKTTNGNHAPMTAAAMYQEMFQIWNIKQSVGKKIAI